MRTFPRSTIGLATPWGVSPSKSPEGPPATRMRKCKPCSRSNPATVSKPPKYTGFYAAANSYLETRDWFKLPWPPRGAVHPEV
jgi:hypothetical protein